MSGIGVNKIVLPVAMILIATLTLGGCVPIACCANPALRDDVYQKGVFLNAVNDGHFVKFLEDNTGKVVVINSEFDASVSTSSEQDIVDQCMLDHDSIDTGGYVGIPMSGGESGISCENTIVFKLAPYDSFETSHGGSGLYYIQVYGFFEIEESFSESRRIFTLKSM